MKAQAITATHGASPQTDRKLDRDPSDGDLRLVLDRVESVGDRHDNQLANLTASIYSTGNLIVRALERIAVMLVVAFAIGTVALCTLAGYGMYIGMPGILQATGR